MTTEVWGEREAVIDRAAREINEMGETAVDTFMSIERLGITPDEVSARMSELTEREEEFE